MGTLIAPTSGAQTLCELQEFARLPAAAQRFIRRSLEIRFGRLDRIGRLARTPQELRSIETQIGLYARLDGFEFDIPLDDDGPSVSRLTDLLAPLAAFDLGEGKIQSFAAFRFLYERVIGAAVRPWLLSIFMLCSALPHLHPTLRLSLLASIDKESAGASKWSSRPAQFYPEWVES